ncbi:MAG: DUF192 domain-containing protein [Candidatus Levybacteria bacterium]|nr:DUF192 domain-containing protein [Candidatus Levybacteria bacterium]
MKKILILIIALFGIILGIVLAQNYLKNNTSFFTKLPTQTIRDKTFKLEVAKTDKDRETGLSDRESLPADRAMLFTFDKSDYYSFWMKDMRFPIDIIFINGDTIVTIYENVQPTPQGQSAVIYQPKSPADLVLEINGGLSSKYGFEEGDKVKIENL